MSIIVKNSFMPLLGVLGCGWLGVPLSKYLKSLGYDVRGSRTSEEGVLKLKKTGIEAHNVVLEIDDSKGISAFINQLKILIIAVPPKKNSYNDDFVKKIQTLLNCLKSSSIERILFLSSTSVYGTEGKIYDETSSESPKTKSAINLLACEKLIKKNSIPSVIIRLGGLIGKDRNPIYQLQGKEIRNPNGKINFVDQEDAVKGVASLVSNKSLNGIFNLVSPHHPERETYYLHVSKKFKLPIPKFKLEKSVVRIINGNKITEVTSFNYNVDNLLI